MFDWMNGTEPVLEGGVSYAQLISHTVMVFVGYWMGRGRSA